MYTSKTNETDALLGVGIQDTLSAVHTKALNSSVVADFQFYDYIPRLFSFTHRPSKRSA